MSITLHQGDAVDWLRSLAHESIDLVVTDPAYESLEKHRAVGTTTRLSHSSASSNDWFEIFKNDRFPELFAEVYRVLRKNAHFYMFCDQETMFVAKPMGEAAGFKFWKPIIWRKDRIGMGYHYRAQYECILFFEKGKRKLNDLGIADVLDAPRVSKGYPTEKPVKINRVLIEQSTLPGELVIDPFMGSGSAGVAAFDAHRSFMGCDLSAKSFKHAHDRLIGIGAINDLPAHEPSPRADDEISMTEYKGLPLFTCDVERQNRSFVDALIVGFKCPCGRRHEHGWGKEARETPQHRGSHCAELHPYGYYIVLPATPSQVNR